MTQTGSASNTRWGANAFTRGLCLVGLPLLTAVFALATLAVYAQGPGDLTAGYVTASPHGCSAHIATTPKGPATRAVQLRDGRYGCGKVSVGHRIYYDPSTLKEVPGPSNYLVGTALLGLLAAGSAYLTVLVWLAWIRLRGHGRGSSLGPVCPETPNDRGV